MSAQFDYLAGVDISSLTSVTQTQFMQAINQLAPLSNIGGVIYQAATSSAQSISAGSWLTSNCPDVTNNPRFAKYIWMNTYTQPPVPFIYSTSTGLWEPSGIADNSISSNKLNKNASSIPPGSTTSAIQHLINESGGTIPTDATMADKVLVYDSIGQYITQVTKASLIASLSISPSQISASGYNGNVLKIVGGVSTYAPIDLSKAGASVGDLQSYTGRMPVDALVNAGNAGWLLQTVGATPTWVSNDDAASSFLPAGSPTVGVDISKLKFPITSALKMLQIDSNGTALEWKAPSLSVNSPATISTTGIVSTTGAGDISVAVHTIAHGLTVIPKLVRVVLKCLADANTGNALGDEISLESLVGTSGNVVTSVVADATNITVLLRAVTKTNLRVLAKGTGAFATPVADANFTIKAYAWA